MSVVNLDPIEKLKAEVRSILRQEGMGTTVSVLLLPTEVEERVRKAVENVFPGTRLTLIKKEGYVDRLEGTAPSLATMHELLRRQQILDTARNSFYKGLEGKEISFQLNKQAALMGYVNFLDHDAPLGGINVNVETDEPELIIDWLAPGHRRRQAGKGDKPVSRISFSAYRMVNYPFSWALGLEDLGFEGWEIVSEGRQKITKETLPEVRDIIGTMDLKITVHGPVFRPQPRLAHRPDLGGDDPAGQAMRRAVRRIYGRRRGAPGLLSPLGNQMPDKVWERNVEALRAICDHAKDYGVRICLENMPNMEKLLCRTPEELFGMVESVDRDNLGTTFDAGHANTTKNTAKYLKEKSRISHVHIHDNKGTTISTWPSAKAPSTGTWCSAR